TLLPRTADDTVVNCQVLSGAVCCKQRPEKIEVIHRRNEFLDACNGDMDFWKRCAETDVSFVLRRCDASCVSYHEIGAGNADVCGGVFFSQQFAGFQRQLLWSSVYIRAELLMEQLCNIFFAEMHCRSNDMIRFLS